MQLRDSLCSPQTIMAMVLVAGMVAGCVPRDDQSLANDTAGDTVAGTDQGDGGTQTDAGADTGTTQDTGSANDTATDPDTHTSTDAGTLADSGSDDGGDDADGDSTTAFRITSPRSDRAVGYRLKVVEQPSKVRDGSRFEAEQENDAITQKKEGWLITGETGTAPSSEKVRGDSYQWPSTDKPTYGIAGWSADAPAEDYTLTIDGTEVDPSTLPKLDTDSGNDDPDGGKGQAGCLGGGKCYKRKVTASDADVTVGASADLGDLQSALNNASTGDVVFVDPAADINLGYKPHALSLEVPAGVTLASDRGVDGSDGALLSGEKKPGSDWEGADTIGVGDGARITGLRIEGPTPDKEMNWLGADHDYTDAIDVGGASDVEIDNNEVYGWPQSAISGGDPVHVHHNYIHDQDQSGLGYGVSSSQWDSVIEYNRFERNRHAVAGSGEAGDGYILRHNVFGSEGIGGAGHKIDMHEEGSTGKAGTRVEIYNNTVKFPGAQGVYLRGTPRKSSEIYNNWFYNSTKPCLTKNEGGSYCAIQVRADDFTNVDYHDNHYGKSEPACDIGAPREGC